jgi:glycerol-3-phosphate acyltransferase PlsX
MVRLALDLMGSDRGPEELSKGALAFLREHEDVSYLLFGKKEVLTPLWKDVGDSRVTILDAPDVIPMEIKPLDFLRRKESSLYLALQAMKEEKADALVTAGSTPGFVIGSTFLLRNLEGVSRAGLCTTMPTADPKKPSLVLDVGANNVNTCEDLVGYAHMGRILFSALFPEREAKTYLLTNGTEEGKGPDEIVQAYEILKKENFPGFGGNVEARDALDGLHPIIVTGGFAGNVFLKATEGAAHMAGHYLKKAVTRNLWSKLGYLHLKSGLKEMKKNLDARQYGGAILLGINGNVVKGHGNSDATAFYHAIRVATLAAKADVAKKIQEEIR